MKITSRICSHAAFVKYLVFAGQTQLYNVEIWSPKSESYTWQTGCGRRNSYIDWRDLW